MIIRKQILLSFQLQLINLMESRGGDGILLLWQKKGFANLIFPNKDFFLILKNNNNTELFFLYNFAICKILVKSKLKEVLDLKTCLPFQLQLINLEVRKRRRYFVKRKYYQIRYFVINPFSVQMSIIIHYYYFSFTMV